MAGTPLNRCFLPGRQGLNQPSQPCSFRPEEGLSVLSGVKPSAWCPRYLIVERALSSFNMIAFPQVFINGGKEVNVNPRLVEANIGLRRRGRDLPRLR